jgi:hypothetical protein
MESAWLDLCRQYSVTDLGEFQDFFRGGQKLKSNELAALTDTASFLDLNLQRSVEHLTRWLPEVDEDIFHAVTIVLLPFGKYTFSPRLGLQFFCLDPLASLTETYLFLVHVYYHEITYLNETPDGRRSSREQSSAADFKKWIKLLIRSEGIGNYAVLEQLLQLRDTAPDYIMRYFSYARKIGDQEVLQSAVSILINVFTVVDDRNVAYFTHGVNKIFRNESLPILNLVGIHMAECIAGHYDAGTLKNVHQREAGEFFALYGKTNAPFSKAFADL